MEPHMEKDKLERNDSKTPSAHIRLRAVILGLVLALGICLITPFNNTYRQATPLGGGHFPLAPFYILVWLTIILALVGKVFRKRTILTGKELLLVWIQMVIVSGIAYTGLVRTFFINLTAPYHFASMEMRKIEKEHVPQDHVRRVKYFVWLIKS